MVRAHRARPILPLSAEKFEGRSRIPYVLKAQVGVCRSYFSLQTFCTQSAGLALSVGPAMAAISPPLHVVRAQHAFCSRAARASLLPRASSALIFPKHSPVRPRLNCLLTVNCSRVPCSEPNSSRSTARLYVELIRRRPGSKGGVSSPNLNTRPPGLSMMIMMLVTAAALTIGPC
jgi:hypothetical protein